MSFKWNVFLAGIAAYLATGALGGGLARADDGFFTGSVNCSGPYEQSQLGWPENSIRVVVKWDPIFNNSDVYLVFKNINLGHSVARFYPNSTQLTYPREYWLESGTMLFQGHRFEVWLEKGTDPAGKIQTARVIANGHLHYITKCH